jgi:hypothetical protein
MFTSRRLEVQPPTPLELKGMQMQLLLLIRGRKVLVAWCVSMMEHFNLVSMEVYICLIFFMLKFKPLLVGIRLCWHTGFRKIMCFSYSLHVVTHVTKGTSLFHRYAKKLEIIRIFFAKRLGNISSSHLFMKEMLVKMCYQSRANNVDPLIVLQERPSNFSSTLLVDAHVTKKKKLLENELKVHP